MIREVYPEPEQGTVDRKIIALLAVLLVLVSMAICYGGYVLLRGDEPVPPAQQIILTEAPLPTPIVLMTEPLAAELYLPVVMRAPSPVTLTAPVAVTSSVWRFLSIDTDDIATFENTTNPNQRLSARCIDPDRSIPDRGALYNLYDNEILRAQFESWNFQRFEVISSK